MRLQTPTNPIGFIKRLAPQERERQGSPVVAVWIWVTMGISRNNGTDVIGGGRCACQFPNL
ncbi:MAG: hypothetical protein OHK0012_13040 [Synechococcales cyanobacterium]